MLFAQLHIQSWDSIFNDFAMTISFEILKGIIIIHNESSDSKLARINKAKEELGEYFIHSEDRLELIQFSTIIQVNKVPTLRRLWPYD